MENSLELALKRKDVRVENLRGQIAQLRPENFAGGLTFEIGCGKGHYLSAYGNAHTDQLCIGIDLISARIRDGERKNEKRGNENVFFIKAECLEFLEALPENLKLERVFIFFPDPWPKKRHHRRRLIQPEFLTLLKQYCAPEVKLYFRTDHEEYFAWAREVFENHTDWQILEGDALPFEEVSQFQRILPIFQTLSARLKV